jgi:hypothetical protein
LLSLADQVSESTPTLTAWGGSVKYLVGSRRSFLVGAGEIASAAWLALHWPSIVVAAHHAEASGDAESSPAFKVLSERDAADVDAIAAQIVPSGNTPGAREARVVHFIDQALATFFAPQAVDFREGLTDFQRAFQAGHSDHAFAAASSADQVACLKTVDAGRFFQTVRLLTVLGLVTSPKYGGNYQKIGWQIMGFDDQHVFWPPFGFYDRDYPGFVPYEKEHT